MKCASPNLDVARLPLCCFFLQKKKEKKMAGWQSGVKVFWSEEKVCNWGPWAGSLHCTSRRIIAWGYKKREEVFLQGGGILFSMPNYCFSIPSFLPPFLFQNTTGFLLIDSLNAVAATGRLLCRHYWDHFQFTPLPSQQGMQFLSVFCSIITIGGAQLYCGFLHLGFETRGINKRG